MRRLLWAQGNRVEQRHDLFGPSKLAILGGHDEVGQLVLGNFTG